MLTIYGEEVTTTWEEVTHYMIDEIREEVHAELAPCTNEAFLNRYERILLERYGEESLEVYHDIIC